MVIKRQAPVMMDTQKNQIITSLVDTDLYKFSMMQWVMEKAPMAIVEYTFKCRTEGVDLHPYRVEIQDELKKTCELRFMDSELRYFRSLRFFKEAFIENLTYFKLNFDHIRVTAVDNGELDITVRGPWFNTILFEMPVLSVVQEVYMRNTADITACEAEGQKRLMDKIRLVQALDDSGFKFADFGTRRRFSREWQSYVVDVLRKELPDNLVGTSNVYLAKEYGLTPIGTMAHEYLQAHQAMQGWQLKDFQSAALQGWADVYRGDLGIALTDVVGLDAFLKDFDRYFAKLFDGVRQDSGCPFKFGDRMIKHYQSMDIDPMTKTSVFSDGLDFPKAIQLYQYFKQRILTSYGIGTNITNDMGVTALSNVMKMSLYNGQPVAKISDSAGKLMCKDMEFLNLLSKTFGIEIQQ